MDIAEVRSKNAAHGGSFRFAVVKGTGDSDHASWWSFDDEQELRDRFWRCSSGETVLDIGAAFGSYALPALAQGARVVAFNPAPFDFELMQANLDLNPELKRRCLHVRAGLHSRGGSFNPDTGQFLEERRTDKPWLETMRLDDFLDSRPGIGDVHWMKLDVEGAELEVLRGAEKCLRMYRPKILVENHEFQIKGIAAQVRAYLDELRLGYRCDGPHQHCAVSHSFFAVA